MKSLKIFFLLLLPLLGYGQQKAELYYMTLKPESDPQLKAQCSRLTVSAVTFKVTFFFKNSPPKIVIAEQKKQVATRDSILYVLNVQKDDYESSDRLTIHPVYHLICKGDTSRGGNIDYEGDDHNSQKIVLIFNSNPQGADVYLIPKPVWAKIPSAARATADLSSYQVYQHPTRVQKNDVQEYVYIALFKYHGKLLPVECSPTHLNPVDSVYADFLKK